MLPEHATPPLTASLTQPTGSSATSFGLKELLPGSHVPFVWMASVSRLVSATSPLTFPNPKQRNREMTSPLTFPTQPLPFLTSPPFSATIRTSIMSSSPQPPRFISLRASSSSVSATASADDTSSPLPVVLGCGATCIDYLATVDSYPKPDDKIRSTSLKIQGGGNAGNALTCAARLGLRPRLISKVADDAQGKGILEELEADGVDTSYFVVSKEGNSPFTYVIVDKQTKTRTCIHTPLYPPMSPDELSQSNLFSALESARLVYFDIRLHETAIVVGKEATQRKIPILVDAEKKRDGLDDLLKMADYVVCSAGFPQEWTDAPSIPSALVSMLLQLPKAKFVIVTLGEDGCIMLERNTSGSSQLEEMDVDRLLESLKQNIDGNNSIPICISSKSVMTLKANNIGAVNGMLRIGTAERILPSELVDTTGAGDAFIGAVLYALCAGKPPEKMLPFAASVAAAACRSLGARSGLPRGTDPYLCSLLN